MKIRCGFVSNSSSVSFSIYGIYMTEHQAREFIERCKERPEDIFPNIGLFCHYDQHGEGLYIGRQWKDIRDEENGSEFKKGVETRLSEVFGEEIVCGTHEEGWFDG